MPKLERSCLEKQLGNIIGFIDSAISKEMVLNVLGSHARTLKMPHGSHWIEKKHISPSIQKAK